MADITAQLREHAFPPYDPGCHGPVMVNAADEIERLREALEVVERYPGVREFIGTIAHDLVREALSKNTPPSVKT